MRWLDLVVRKHSRHCTVFAVGMTTYEFVCALCLCEVLVFDEAQHGECQQIFRNGTRCRALLLG